jgi:hypothetical protein
MSFNHIFEWFWWILQIAQHRNPRSIIHYEFKTHL